MQSSQTGTAQIKPIAIVSVLVLVAFLVYTFWPGAERTVNEAYAGISEQELSDNWEYYYDQEVKKLEAKLTDFERQRVETVKESLSLEDDLEDLETEISDSQALILQTAERVKAATASGGESVTVLNDEVTIQSATEQLRTWIGERHRMETQRDQLAEALERTNDIRRREISVFEKAKAQIAALKREKTFMRSQLKIADIENRLRTLEQVSTAWFESEDLSDLQQVRDVISDKLLHAEARAELMREEASIDNQVGLDEAILEQRRLGQDAAVESELGALLGE